MNKSALRKKAGIIAAGVAAFGIGAGSAYAECKTNEYVIPRTCGSVREKPTVQTESYKDSFTRFNVGVESDGERKYGSFSITWKVGGNTFGGPYVEVGSEAKPSEWDMVESASTATELVGPGVNRTRTDTRIKHEKNTLGKYGIGGRIVHENGSWRYEGNAGFTQEKKHESRTLSSTVKFVDSSGNQIGNVLTTDYQAGIPRSDTTVVPALKFGVGYELINRLIAKFSANIVFREKTETKLRAGLEARF